MKTYKNHILLFSLALMFALQSCERREDITERLGDPLYSDRSYICKFNAIILDDEKSSRHGNGVSYLIDGALKGYDLTSRRLVFEANYKRGVLDGPLKRYHGIGGGLSSLLTLSNGLREGEYKGYTFFTEWIGLENKVRERVVSGNYRQDKIDGEWKINNKDGSIVAVFKFEQGDNLSILAKWMSSSGYIFEFMKGGKYKMSFNGERPSDGVYAFDDDEILLKPEANKRKTYYRISSYDSGSLVLQGISKDDPNEYTMTRLSQ